MKKLLSVLLILVLLCNVIPFAVSAKSFWKNGGLSLIDADAYSNMGYGFTKLNVTDARGCIDAPDLDAAPYYLVLGIDGQFPVGHWELLHLSNDERNSNWNPKGSANDIYISFPNPNASPKNITVMTKADDEEVMTGVPFMPQTAYIFKFAKENEKLVVYCNGTKVFEGAEQLGVFSGENLWFTTDGNIGENDTFLQYPMFINPDFDIKEEPEFYFTTGPKSGCGGYSKYITDLTKENMLAFYDEKGYTKVIIDSVHDDGGNPAQVGESVSANIPNPKKQFEISVIADKLTKGNWCTIGIYNPLDGEKSFAQSAKTLRFNMSNGGYSVLDFYYEYNQSITLIEAEARVVEGEENKLRFELVEGEEDIINIYYNDVLQKAVSENDENISSFFEMMRSQILRVGVVGSNNMGEADTLRIKVKNGASETGLISLAMSGASSVRFCEPNGLRFESKITGWDTLSENTLVECGMLIVPYSCLEDGTEFTQKALEANGKNYLDIKCSQWAHEPDGTNNYHIMRAVISNIKPENFDCAFAARSYAEITFENGDIKIIYSDFNEENVCSVAEASYDIKFGAEYEELDLEEQNIVKKFAYFYGGAEKYDRYEKVDFSSYDTGNDAKSINNAIEAVKAMRKADEARYERVSYTLELPNRRYELDDTLKLYSVEDLTLNGNGCDFVFTKSVTAILMDSCKNVKFNSFNIDYDPLRYTQGVVKQINGLKCTVEIDEGYPYDIDFINGIGVDDVYGDVSFGEQTFTVNIHDETGAVKPDTPTYVFKTNAVSLGGRLVEIEAHSNSLFEGSPLGFMSEGDMISLSYIGPKLLWAESGKGGMEFENINVYSTPGAGFWELSGEGGTLYKNVKVVPGEKPEGATKERVLAMSGDCIHSTMLKKGPIIDSCTFTNLADDAVNMNGLVYYVLSSSGNKTVVAPRWNYPFYIGEEIRGYDGTDLYATATARVTAITVKNDPEMSEIIKELYKDMDQQWGDNTLIYEVTTDKPLDIKYGDCIMSQNRRCSGAVIKNSTFGKNRSRGIVAKGDDILIENNTITGCMFPSIAVQLDTGFGESGFSSNVIIRGNKVINSSVGKDMTMAINRENMGAIMVNILLDRAHNGMINNYSHENIVIEDNIIDGTALYGISCTNVDGLTVRNNTINNPFMFGIGTIGQNSGIEPNAGIFIGQCKNVSVSDNTVTGGPEEIIQAVQIHSNVKNIIENINNIKN